MGLSSWVFWLFWSWPGLIFVTALTALYVWRIRLNGTWARRGIPHKDPSLLFGNENDFFLKKVSFFDYFKRLYWEMPDESVSGFIQITTPILLVRDVELIKEITVKKFDCFANHVFSEIPEVDKIFGKGLFTMVDQKWRVTRNMLSPAFTGLKMRTMFKLMNDCAENTANSISEKLVGGMYMCEVKDLFNRYCNDTIATTIFGVEVNSIKDLENEFFLMGKQLTTLSTSLASNIKGLLVFMIPKIFPLLGLNLLDIEATNYFIKLVKDTIQYRIDNQIVRPDMINMYIESQKEDNKSEDKVIDNEYVVKTNNDEAISKKWDLDEFVAQCVLFFFAGFETAANWFMLMAYELAINPEVQEKLLAEIDEVKNELGDKPVTFEKLQSMKYFECVIQESLRKWPVNVANDRRCTKDCTLYDSKGKAHHFKEGDFINLPSIGIQRDSRYFEDPEKFLPERWSTENKEKINPYTLLTFGIGPRMCIGNRYVMMEGKCVFFSLLSRFRIERCDKTQESIQFKKGGFNIIVEDGVWLNFKRRN
ncbi:probable cytochrome P450 9f2 [Culicoides brevitarsis]|uniref:probable cytochrome P450 9f2 n=1 Tax=Culicoides brevitarsis TaxID=469753 RepID=UPI00307CC6A4